MGFDIIYLVCYKKRGDRILCFVGYGNLHPRVEFVKCFGNKINICYNYERKQSQRSRSSVLVLCADSLSSSKQ